MPAYSMKSIKIVLADDHEIVREAIRTLIDKVPEFVVVGEVPSGEEAVDLVRKLMKEGCEPDIILMDIKMPGIGGLEATRKLRLVSPNIKIVVLTSCEDDIFPPRLLKAGAAGYLTKSAGVDEMIRALRAVNSGQRYITPNIANELAISHVTGKTKSPFEQLSGRELQICMMITKGELVKDIAELLHLSPKTVNSYRYRMFEKLGVDNNVGLTRMAMRYRLLEDMPVDEGEGGEGREEAKVEEEVEG